MDAKHAIVLFLMLATGAVLLVGIGVMVKGGKLNEKYGNKLMVLRVTLQGLTLLMLAVFFLASKK